MNAPQKPPKLIVYGHFNIPPGSNVTVSAGQSLIDPPQGAKLPLTAPLALSLSARHKDWQATFTLPSTFTVEALQLIEGEIDIIDPDEPVDGSSRKPRKYVTGTWLRFVTGTGLDLPLPSPPTIPLPLRSYPPMPALSAQGFSELSGTDLDSVKAWSLDCTYRHQFAAQDTVHITAVLNEPPPAPRRLMAAMRRPRPARCALTLFQAALSVEYPRHVRQSNLRLPAGHAAPPAAGHARCDHQLRPAGAMHRRAIPTITCRTPANTVSARTPTQWQRQFELAEFFATEDDPDQPRAGQATP